MDATAAYLEGFLRFVEWSVKELGVTSSADEGGVTVLVSFSLVLSMLRESVLTERSFAELVKRNGDTDFTPRFTQLQLSLQYLLLPLFIPPSSTAYNTASRSIPTL